MVTTQPKPAASPATAPVAEAPAESVWPLILKLPPEWRLTDDAFDRLGACNEMLELERTAKGELVIAPPPTGKGPDIAARLCAAIINWIDAGGGGRAREGSGGYRLGELPPTEEGSSKLELRAPDVSWISAAQLEAMAQDYDDGYPHLAPAFMVEIISPYQSIADQQTKMEMWMRYGVRLGWLIDPKRERVWIYRAGQDEPQFLERPETLSGEDVLAGFTLDCSRIWS